MTMETLEQAVARVVAERTAAERERAEKLAQVRLRGEVEAGMKRLEAQERESAKVAEFQRKQVAQLKADERARWVGNDETFDRWWQQGGEVATIARHSAESAHKAHRRAQAQYAEF
jgi:hypothetical protein